MADAKLIAGNSAALIITKIISSVLSVFVSIYLVRYLGSEGYGKFSIVFAYLSFFQILTSFGIDTILIREISRDNLKQNEFVSTAVLMKVIFSVFAIIFSWIILEFFGYSKEIKLYIYIASMGMFFNFSTTFVGLFQARLKIVYYTIPELALNVISSGVMLLMILLKGSIIYFIIIQTASIVPLMTLYFILARKISGFNLSFKFNPKIVKFLLIESWPIFISTFFISINSRIDQVMLFSLLGGKPLGLYSAIVKITEILNFIPSMIMIAIFPLFSFYSLHAKDKFVNLYSLSFKYMSIIIIPISFGTTLLSERLIILIYGNNFAIASSALSILIWSSVFMFFGIVNANIFNSSGLQKYILLFTFTAAATNVLLNLILIPKYGITGASISTVFSYSGFGFVLQYYIKSTREIIKSYFRSTIKPIISSIPMIIFIHFFNAMNLFLLILFGAIIYGIFLILTKCFGASDVIFIKQILSFRNNKTAKIDV